MFKDPGVQGFLTAVANISKALWGPKGKRAQERAPLRATLKVDEASPLKPTSMRNNFDHFDDRLDTWWRTSVNHNSTDYAIASDATNFVDWINRTSSACSTRRQVKLSFGGTDTLSSP